MQADLEKMGAARPDLVLRFKQKTPGFVLPRLVPRLSGSWNSGVPGALGAVCHTSCAGLTRTSTSLFSVGGHLEKTWVAGSSPATGVGGCTDQRRAAAKVWGQPDPDSQGLCPAIRTSQAVARPASVDARLWACPRAAQRKDPRAGDDDRDAIHSCEEQPVPSDTGWHRRVEGAVGRAVGECGRPAGGGPLAP